MPKKRSFRVSKYTDVVEVLSTTKQKNLSFPTLAFRLHARPVSRCSAFSCDGANQLKACITHVGASAFVVVAINAV